MKINLGAKPDEQPRQPAITLKPKEVNLQTGDPLHLYHKRAENYISQFNYTAIASLQEALLSRASGKLVLTYREADIAARGKINLGSLTVKKTIREDGWFLTEGVAGTADSAFELRSFYNRGVQFYTSGKVNHVDPMAKKNAEFAMRDIRDKFNALNLPLWPEEINAGFPMELCKPDYMTWDQYRKRMQNPITIGDSHAEMERKYKEERETDVTPNPLVGSTITEPEVTE